VYITSAVAEFSYGAVVTGRTEKGMCFLSLGDAVEQVLVKLSATYPEAHCVASSQPDPAEEAILAYLEGQGELPDVPLDVHGSAFFERVWAKLRAIPAGETRTYRQIAQHLGAPLAARAVGAACAANPVSLFIPCHRAIRTDGGLGGYGGGLERKRRLIDTEAAFARGVREAVATPRLSLEG
jgi:O-6-methylguanine DNA methyltransferase